MSTAAQQRAYVARQMAERPDEFLAYRRRVRAAWQRNSRDKVNAHQRVAYAVKTGRLVRPDSCSACGADCRPEAHHDDYSRPLDVRWLCRLCHGTTRRKGPSQ